MACLCLLLNLTAVRLLGSGSGVRTGHLTDMANMLEGLALFVWPRSRQAGCGSTM